MLSRQGRLKRTFETYQQDGIPERAALLRARLEERLKRQKEAHRKDRSEAQNAGHKVGEFDEEAARQRIDEEVRESTAAMRIAVGKDMKRIIEQLEIYVGSEVQQLADVYLLRFHNARERASQQIVAWQSAYDRKLDTISPAAIDAMSDTEPKL